MKYFLSVFVILFTLVSLSCGDDPVSTPVYTYETLFEQSGVDSAGNGFDTTSYVIINESYLQFVNGDSLTVSYDIKRTGDLRFPIQIMYSTQTTPGNFSTWVYQMMSDSTVNEYRSFSMNKTIVYSPLPNEGTKLKILFRHRDNFKAYVKSLKIVRKKKL